MKKKYIAVLAAAALAATVTGCSQELSNDYVTVKEYKGLEIPEPEKTEVTDEQVEQSIQSSLQSSAQRTEVTDRPAQEGDLVNIDYTGYLNGKEFEGGSAKGSELKLGSGTFIGATDDYPGFEEQIEGHSKGEEFDITVQFPDPYQYNDAMSGAVTDFHIVLNGIYTETIPELTDEWVQKNTDVDTVDAYRKEVKKQLQDSNEETMKSQMAASVQSALLGKLEIKGYPQKEVDALKDQIKDYYSQIASLYGMETKDFIENNLQTTEEDFDAKITESAQQSVALDQAFKLIAKKENLEPSDKEYDKKIAKLAEEAGMDSADAYIKQVGEDAAKETVLRDVVTDYLIDKCVQVEQDDTDK